MTQRLGLDLGGSSVKWAVLEADGMDSDSIAVATTGEVPTRVDLDPRGIVDQLCELARSVAARVGGVASVGVGVPGLYDASTGETRLLPNLPGDWSGVPLAEPIGRLLGAPTRLLNDARAFTIAESILGAGRGAGVVLGVTVGTGIGGGISFGGRVYHGHEGTAGEIGHQTILLDGPLCSCGNRGCLETLVSARALAAACGQTTVERAVEAARAGDPRAARGFAQCGTYLGVGIANAIVLLTPDVVVVGGGVARAGDLLLGPARDEIRRRVRVTDLAGTSIVTSTLGVWAGAVGASIHGGQR